MAKEIRDKVFQDEKCTCDCGNTHELYGGKGYTTIDCEGYSNGQVNGGFYKHTVKCNCCEKEYTLQF